jgi:hypothetical protein
MSETWISDGATHAALADPADPAELDAWRLRGWEIVDAPTHEDFVFMWRDGIAEPGRVPVYALRNLWGPRGWVVGPPPGGAHPFAPKPPTELPESKPETQSAAGGQKVKEKAGA